MLFGTGFGELNPPDANGLQTLVVPVFAFVNGQPAQVVFAGAAPGLPGVQQINVLIPAGTPPGQASVQIVSQIVPAQSGLTVAVN
jgi:uncharacterized protein (TIGR03437 family)